MLELFPDDILNLPITVLSLEPKIINALQGAEIKSVCDLLEARDKGCIINIKNVGGKTISKIDNALRDLSVIVQIENGQKSECLSDPRPALLPDYPNGDIYSITFINDFAKELYYASQKGRCYEILKMHFGLEGCRIFTLKEIGDGYGLTRERVRKLEEMGLSYIRNALLSPINLDWRIPENILEESQELYKLLEV